MSKLALAIIAKDEVDRCLNIINKYGSYFDEIVIAFDKREEDFLKICSDKVHCFKYDWDEYEKEIGYPKFDKKRNFLAGKINSNHYFRMDTDDEIEGSENIRKVFNDIVANSLDVIYFPYHYAFDDDGSCIAEHWRESVIVKKKGIYWKKHIHEKIFIDDLDSFKGHKDDRVRIIHKTTPERAEESEQRNFKFLVDEFEKDKEDTDPRTVAYIGRVLLGRGMYDKAIPFMELLLKNSGWDDDKYFAYVQMGEAYMRLGNMDQAVACCNEALAINVDYPDAYLMIGMTYLEKGDYSKAINWLLISKGKKKPNTMVVMNPSLYTFMTDMNIAMAYLGLGKYKEGYEFYKLAKSVAPNNKFILDKESLFTKAIENDTFLKNTLWNLKYSEKYDPQNCKNIVDAIPQNLLNVDNVYRMKNQYTPGERWAGDTVVIFCGRSWEDWASPSVMKGLGGSEEAVVYISQELTKLGYKVTVFNNCGDMKGKYNGVEYRNYFELNPKDHFNIFISWRGSVFSEKIKAERRIVWLHDVPQPGQFTEDSLSHIDKILVLSEYHKSLLPSFFPQDKILVSANGINVDDFDVRIKPDRNPKRMIYTSSYDRGIQHLLLMWPEIRKEVPDAELHLFYGWNTYDKMMKDGMRSSDFKDKMVELMNQDGVYEHGRVGHKELIKEFYKSGLWVYPSHFEEISCISAMKAQVCGCVPVYVNYAALRETVKDGVSIEGKAGDGDTNEQYRNELINILNKPELQEVYRERLKVYRDRFSWEEVAKQWSREAFIAKEELLV